MGTEMTRSDIEDLRATLMAAVTRMERRLVRAHLLCPVGLVVGLATVPHIAERLFG